MTVMCVSSLVLGVNARRRRAHEDMLKGEVDGECCQSPVEWMCLDYSLDFNR